MTKASRSPASLPIPNPKARLFVSHQSNPFWNNLRISRTRNSTVADRAGNNRSPNQRAIIQETPWPLHTDQTAADRVGQSGRPLRPPSEPCVKISLHTAQAAGDGG